MAQFKLQAQPREKKGRSYRKELMNRGKVPGVLYGKNVESTPLELNWRDFHDILTQGGQNAIINLDIENNGNHTVMVKELQYDSITRFLMHVDFQQISMQDKLQVSVPINITGEVKDGVMQVLEREINVSCLPGNIPENIEVDVSKLNVGDSLTVADLEVPEGVTVESEPDAPVVTVTAERADRVAETGEEEAEEAGEAEESEGAEEGAESEEENQG